MLIAAFVILGVAVLLGSVLALLHLREGAAEPPWPLGALHGLLAIGGLGGLILTLGGPPRGLEQGTASFVRSPLHCFCWQQWPGRRFLRRVFESAGCRRC